MVSRSIKHGVRTYKLEDFLTGSPIQSNFYEPEMKLVTNVEKASDIEKIHSFRLNPYSEQEVLVSFKENPKKKQWVPYANLIKYKNS